MNRAAMEEIVEEYNDSGDGELLNAMLGTDSKQLLIYRLTADEIDWIYEILGSLKTPYLQNEALEKAVLETGEKLLRGELDMETAVKEVQSRVKLSMAE